MKSIFSFIKFLFKWLFLLPYYIIIFPIIWALKKTPKFLYYTIVLPTKWIFKWGLKSLLYASLVLIPIITILFIALFFVDDILTYAINHSTQYIDLNAKVEKVQTNLLTQRITLKNVVLKNPDGFPVNDALKISQITLKLDVFNPKTPIKRLYLRDVKLRIEGRSGRRIMAHSIVKSNLYVIAREISRTFDIKLEQHLLKNSKENSTPTENTSAYTSFRDFLKKCEGVDELRVEALRIENGADVYALGSIICNDKYILASNYKSTIFGVDWGIQNLFCNFNDLSFGLSNFYIRNPKEFKKNNVFSIKKIRISTVEETTANGGIVPKISSIDIDSPTIYFEDKNGSMLGAIGMDNNFAGIYKTIQSMTRYKLDDLFQDEFEIVPEHQEFKLPEIKLDKLFINNARIICSKKDAGLLANKITFSNNKIDIDDIRAHMGGLRLDLAGVEVNSEKQYLKAKDFILRNPAGFPEESAFRFKNFHMSTNFTERVIRGNRVLEIGDIEVNKFFVRLDSRSGKLFDLLGNDNNLFALLDSIAKMSAQMPINSANASKSINEDKTKRPHRYTVKTVKLTNGIILIGPRGDSIKIPFKDVAKEDIGVDVNGLTAPDLTTELLTDIISNSLEGAQSKVSEEIGGVILAPIITVLRIIITTF